MDYFICNNRGTLDKNFISKVDSEHLLDLDFYIVIYEDTE